MGYALHLRAAPARDAIEGSVRSFKILDDGGVRLHLATGAATQDLTVSDAGGHAPRLGSLVRAESAVVAGWGQVELEAGAMFPVAGTVAELQAWDNSRGAAVGMAELKGQVLGISPDGCDFLFKDETGAELIRTRDAERSLRPGQMIRIEGEAVTKGDSAEFGVGALVDNDGIHEMRERSAKIFLRAGMHDLRLDWFNRSGLYGLKVFYAGPGIPRQPIPDAVLFHRSDAPEANASRFPGLNDTTFEGSWLRMPDTSTLMASSRGTARNFDIGLAPRRDEVGIEFKGAIRIQTDGVYTFSVESDDGSLLFVDETGPDLTVLSDEPPPKPEPIGALVDPEAGASARWCVAEGTVTFASAGPDGAELELNGDQGVVHVHLADGSGVSPTLLLNTRIRVQGISAPVRDADGRVVPGTLMAPGIGQVCFWAAGSAAWTNQPAPPPPFTPEASTASTNLPALTKISQIKRLTREQWQEGYPVKIRGVITAVLDSGVFIEDSTWSIYARWPKPLALIPPRIGEYWEIEGKTFAEFAPNILVSRAIKLGPGALPEPLRPTWDQLLNGSLDTKYVEIEGILSEVVSNTATLLTPGGNLGLVLLDLQPQALPAYDNAMVRLRGCVIPERDIRTQQIEPGRIRLLNDSICVDEPAPADPFAAPQKRASDLLLFDWRAGALERVKIVGQIMHERRGEYLLLDGRQGVRILPKTPQRFHPGDLVEAAGFVELGGLSPTLREAVMRQVGAAALPAGEALAPEVMLDRRQDCRRVIVEGKLANLSRDYADDILEMKAGDRTFIARLARRDGPLPQVTLGSVLQLTGIYAGLERDSVSGRQLTGFELLLNSGADVRVLKTPPWWTPGRALSAMGGLVLVVFSGVVWIAFLRRKVEERSQQLAAEVRRHAATERQRELESERARIARDLHDDLGAGLTQIRFLSALESRDSRAPETTRLRMEQVSRKSRDMVESLDEIVWAINPSNDSVASLANYLSHFAEEFLSATPIRCRLDVADDLPSVPLTSEVRHHLYLAVREALNNIAKHSGATEVWLRMAANGGELRVVLEDNGRGFVPIGNGNGVGAASNGNGHQSGAGSAACDGSEKNGHGETKFNGDSLEAGPSGIQARLDAHRGTTGDGLTNMRQRMAAIAGQFQCDSRPGAGSTFVFTLPLRDKTRAGSGNGRN